MIKGVIFDMDGVLVDSEPFICEAAIAMFAELGYTVQPNDFLPFVGTGENRYVGGVAEKYGIPGFDAEVSKARTYQLYGEIVKGRLSPLPGVAEFIAKARARGLKLALASSADVVKIKINLQEIGLPHDTFDAVVSGQDVEKKKPSPDIFALAAKKIGQPATDCLVVEDAVTGVAAAKSAGARCLALTTSFTEAELAGADWFAPSLACAPDACLEW